MQASIIDASSWTGTVQSPPRPVTQAIELHSECSAEDLSKLLVAHAPTGLAHVTFCDSSDSAIKSAVSMARAHVNTIAAISPAVVPAADTTIPAPWSFPLPAGTTLHDLESETLSMLAAVLSEQRTAVIIEPSMMNPGRAPVPPGFVRKVRLLCDEHDALLIADETRVGAGRTGFLWGCTRDAVTPDLLVGGEGLTCRVVPFGSVLSTDATHVPQPGHIPTREACNAATAWLRVLVADSFLGEVRRKAANLMDALSDLLPLEPVGDVRVRGLAAGIEIVAGPQSGSASGAELATRIAENARAAGVVFAVEGSVIGITPSLLATDDEIRMIGSVLRAALTSPTAG
ncbi:MAG: hypothetical protein NVSMB57_17260 [Actinomycetota bacterium]